MLSQISHVPPISRSSDQVIFGLQILTIDDDDDDDDYYYYY